METKDCNRHSTEKDAASFKKVFGGLVHNDINKKIHAVNPDVAKAIFAEASGGKEASQKFFKAKLEKYGVSSPSELSGDEKKKCFDGMEAEWEGNDESLTEGKSVTIKDLKKALKSNPDLGVDLDVSPGWCSNLELDGDSIMCTDEDGGEVEVSISDVVRINK